MEEGNVQLMPIDEPHKEEQKSALALSKGKEKETEEESSCQHNNKRPPWPNMSREERQCCHLEETSRVPEPVHQDLVSTDFVCIICAELMSEPKTIPCSARHMACSACLRRWLRENEVCPLDREPVNSLLVDDPPPMVRRMIGSVKVDCTYRTEGCDWQGAFSDFLAHQASRCPFVRVKCLHEECPLSHADSEFDWPRRMDLEEHSKTCDFRKKSCTYCNEMVVAILMETHHEECSAYPINCINNCELGKDIPRGEMKNHLTSLCPKQVIPCPFKDYGCKIGGKRKREEMKEHLKETTDEHLLLLVGQIESLKRTVKQKLDPETMVTSCNVVWDVHNFLNGADYLLSHRFSFAGLKWYVRLDPDGWTPQTRGYFSIFLYSEVTEQDLESDRKVNISYNFKLVNFANEALSIKRGIGASEFPRTGGRGFSKFVKASIVTSLNGFVRNDAIVLEIELTRIDTSQSVTIGTRHYGGMMSHMNYEDLTMFDRSPDFEDIEE